MHGFAGMKWRYYRSQQELSVKNILGNKSSIFWDITPCNPLKVNQRFGRKCLLHPFRAEE
jgi:hypothetical protein